MVEAQLGTGDLSADAAEWGLTIALQMIDKCFAGTAGKCPPGAVTFVMAVIDSMLASPACDAGMRRKLEGTRTALA